jgi:hypothetical protein
MDAKLHDNIPERPRSFDRCIRSGDDSESVFLRARGTSRGRWLALPSSHLVRLPHHFGGPLEPFFTNLKTHYVIWLFLTRLQRAVNVATVVCLQRHGAKEEVSLQLNNRNEFELSSDLEERILH